MTRHLQACIPKHTDRLETGSEDTQSAVHATLRAEGMFSSAYRVDLIVDGTTPLSALDRVLRKVWMECCGHMSTFWRDRPWGDEVDDQQTIRRLLRHDDIVYGYDFGTTSFAEIQLKDAYTLEGPAASVQCIARNEMPEVTCEGCDDAEATTLCPYCLFERAPSVFCDACATEHEEGGCPNSVGNMMLPILNSPRSGLCAYTGPSVEPNRLASPTAN